MTTTVPAPRSGAYRLDDALANDTPLSAVHQPMPNEAAREELLLQKLGARGWGRMHHFRNFYQPGWGDARGKSLSPRASEAFFRFIEAVQFPAKCVPSLFLTDQGGLELRWEDGGHDVQVEFTSDGIEYSFAATGREDFLPHSQVSSLAGQLSAR